MKLRNQTNIEELNQWWDALPPARRDDQLTHWFAEDLK